MAGLLAQSQESGGEAVGVVADISVFAAEVANDAANAKGLDAVHVGQNGRCAFLRVAGQGFGREAGGIDDSVVKDRLAGVVVDALNVLGSGETKALVGLTH